MSELKTKINSYSKSIINSSLKGKSIPKHFLTNNLNNIINEKNSIKFYSEEEQYFLTCFDPSDSSIFFYEYFTNKILTDPDPPKIKIPEDQINIKENNINNNEKTNDSILFDNNNHKNSSANLTNLIVKEEKNELKEIIKHFSDMWLRIKELSEYENNFYLSNEVKNKYNKRPFLSRFLYPEKLGKLTYTSTFPLPQVLSRYEKISLNIYYHTDITTYCKDIQPVIYQKDVGLFYVVDTLIKDCIINLMGILENHKLNDEHYCKENNITSKYEEHYIDKFNKLLSNTKNKFILKLCVMEEYLFGDFPISTYEQIRKTMRERETVNLLLMRFDESEVKPVLSNFPYIIQIKSKQGYNYPMILNEYKTNFVKDNEKSILFMYKSEFEKNECKDSYMKRNIKRRELLTKYCETGEADYPFVLTVKSLCNISSILRHVASENYEFQNMILLTFKKSLRIKKNFFEELAKKFIFCKKKKKGEEEERIKLQQHEAKLNKKREKDYKIHVGKLNELNFMEFQTNNEESISLKIKTKFEKFQHSKAFKKYYEQMPKKNSFYKNFEIDVENKINYYNPDSESYESPFNMVANYLDFLPSLIVIEVSLIYGSNRIRMFRTKTSIIKEDIVINEKINFSQKFIKINENKDKGYKPHNKDYDFLYFSNIPRESRLSFDILCYDGDLNKHFVLGSGSMQIYDEHGIMKSGLQELYIWPFFENDLRVVNTFPFNRKSSFDKSEKFDKRNFGILYIELPKFAKPLHHTVKTHESYSDFLKIKHTPTLNFEKHHPKITKKEKYEKYKFPEFRKFYFDSISNTENLIKHMFNTYTNHSNEKNVESHTNENHNFANEEESAYFLNKDLQKLLNVLNIDSYTTINDEDRYLIIKSRDYISTTPSKLELFLRCINWFDPIQANIAKTYIKKWARIEPIDAIGLLDARFLDNNVREHALDIIKECTDDVKNLYILQILYALMYDPYYESSLTDFIIENSIKCPSFGFKFIVMSKILRDHPIFTEKLSIITSQILMLAGSKFVTDLDKTTSVLKLFFNISKRSKFVKETYKLAKNPLVTFMKNELEGIFGSKHKISQQNLNKENSITINNYIQQTLNNSNQKKTQAFEESNLNKNNKYEIITNSSVDPLYNGFSQGAFFDVYIPIFPSFLISDNMFDKIKIFDSKMVPIKYSFYPSEGNYTDFAGKLNLSSNLRTCVDVFYKNGDDLRQDHIAIQVLRTMDKLWLENDLDLKVFGYSVIPTGQKEGFMENNYALPYNKVQTSKSISGIFDRELIKKHFDKIAQDIVDSFPNETENKQNLLDEIKLKQVDNFVRSLAGYCVGTCVLGIADRHSDNIMVQDNGIFLHIDFGHILGNFKEKLGFKREKSKFVLDQTMVNFCKQYNMEEEFKNFCVKAYNILRKNANRLLNLLLIMSSSGMPEFYSIPNINYFRDMLKLEKKNDEDAGNYFLCLINQSKNDKYRYFDNIFHNINHLNGLKKEDEKTKKKGFFKNIMTCFSNSEEKSSKVKEKVKEKELVDFNVDNENDKGNGK